MCVWGCEDRVTTSGEGGDAVLFAAVGVGSASKARRRGRVAQVSRMRLVTKLAIRG